MIVYKGCIFHTRHRNGIKPYLCRQIGANMLIVIIAREKDNL